MLNRISVRVEQSRVPVAQRLVSLLTIVRQTDVATAKVQLCIVAGHDDKWVLGTVGVVCFTTVWKIKNHGIIKHLPASFRHALKSGDHTFDQRHVMMPAPRSNLFGSKAADGLSVPHVVHVDFLAFDSRNTCIGVSKLINRKRHNISQT